MASVGLSFQDRHIAITGNGPIVQKEQRENGKITKCLVMKLLSPSERLMHILQTEHSTMIRIIDPYRSPDEVLVAEDLKTIPLDKAGQWLVLEYSVETDTVRYYYSPGRV